MGFAKPLQCLISDLNNRLKPGTPGVYNVERRKRRSIHAHRIVRLYNLFIVRGDSDLEDRAHRVMTYMLYVHFKAFEQQPRFLALQDYRNYLQAKSLGAVMYECRKIGTTE